jgi:hypothetical protein
MFDSVLRCSPVPDGIISGTVLGSTKTYRGETEGAGKASKKILCASSYVEWKYLEIGINA